MENLLKEQLMQSFSGIKKIHTKFFKNADITPVEFHTIKLIQKISEKLENETQVYVSMLQKKMELTMPAVSQILNSLDKKGFIVRNISTEDRRKIYVKLTGEGKRILNEINDHNDKILGKFIELVGEDDIKELIRIFEKALNALENIK
jgi:Transcriptional regulators